MVAGGDGSYRARWGHERSSAAASPSSTSVRSALSVLRLAPSSLVCCRRPESQSGRRCLGIFSSSFQRSPPLQDCRWPGRRQASRRWFSMFFSPNPPSPPPDLHSRHGLASWPTGPGGRTRRHVSARRPELGSGGCSARRVTCGRAGELAGWRADIGQARSCDFLFSQPSRGCTQSEFQTLP